MKSPVSKQRPSERMAKVVASFEAQLQASIDRLDPLEAECGAALVLAELDPTDANIKAADAKRSELTACRNEIADRTVAVRIAEKQHERALAEESAAQMQVRRQDVGKLQAECASLAADVQRLIAELAPKCLALAKLRDQIKVAFPWNVDRFDQATMTTGAHVGMLVRLELFRAGLTWAVGNHRGAFDARTVKPITERIAEADKILARFFDQGGVDGEVPARAAVRDVAPAG